MAKKTQAVPVRAPNEPDAEFLVRLLGEPPGTVIVWGPYRVSIELLSPDECARILRDHNHRNRGIAPSVELRYRTDVNLGRWKFNGDVVRFDSNDNLIDGQHRLKAHMTAGRPLLTLVIRGCPPDVVTTIDGVRRRTLRNAFEMADVAHPGECSVVAQWVRRLVDGPAAIAGLDGQVVPYASVLNVYTDFAAEITEAIAYTCFGDVGSRLRSKLGVGQAAALYAVVSKTHRVCIREFFEVLGMSAGWRDPPRRCPAWNLNDRIARAARSKEEPKKKDVMLWVVRGWNAWAEHREITVIQGIANWWDFPDIVGFSGCASWARGY